MFQLLVFVILIDPEIVPSFSSGNLFNWAPESFDATLVVFYRFPCFSEPQDIPGSSWTVPAPDLESSKDPFSKDPWFFLLRIDIY